MDWQEPVSQNKNGTHRRARFFECSAWRALISWLGPLAVLLVGGYALLNGRQPLSLDWIDIVGEGLALGILQATFWRFSRATLDRKVRLPLNLGLLAMILALSADWFEEFYADAPLLKTLENLGLIVGGPLVLLAILVEEKLRGRETSRLQKTVDNFADLALRDTLTGLGSRRAFDEYLAEMARRESGALLLVDLDRFKKINDGYGHDVGDEILRLTGPLIAGGLRENDRAFRFGGEEFAIFVDTDDLRHAQDITERLRERYATLDHPVLVHGRRVGTFGTLSVGVALWSPGLDAQTLFRAADRALYRAKQSGRNRVETA